MRRLAWIYLFSVSLGCAATSPGPLAAPTPHTVAKPPASKAPRTDTPPQDVPQPVVATAPSPFELGTTVDFDQAKLPANKPSTRIVRIRLKVPKLDTEHAPPVNVVLAVDTSGSMRGDAMERTREAAHLFVDTLSAGDRFALVRFGSTAHAVVPSGKLDRESRAKVHEAIQKLEAGGTTDLSGGLAHASAQARAHYTAGSINRVVLLSDGVPNNPTAVAAQLPSLRQRGISVTTLGLGLEYDETMLGMISERTGGKFHFVEQPDLVAQVLRDEVLQLQRVAALHASVFLRHGPSVTIKRVFGHPTQPAQQGLMVQLGDLVEDSERVLLVEVAVGSHRDGASVELFDVDLRFARGDTRAGVDQTFFVDMPATANRQLVAASGDLEVQLAALRAASAVATIDAISLARGGRVKAAKALLKAQIAALARGQKIHDAPDLSVLRKELIALAPTLRKLAPPKRRVGSLPGGNSVRPERVQYKPGATKATLSAHSNAMDTLGM